MTTKQAVSSGRITFRCFFCCFSIEFRPPIRKFFTNVLTFILLLPVILLRCCFVVLVWLQLPVNWLLWRPPCRRCWAPIIYSIRKDVTSSLCYIARKNKCIKKENWIDNIAIWYTIKLCETNHNSACHFISIQTKIAQSNIHLKCL